MTQHSPRRLVGALLCLALSAGCGQIPLSSTYLGSRTYGTTAVAPAGWETYTAERMGGAGGPQAFLQGFGAGGNDPAWPVGHSVPGGLLTVSVASDPAGAAAMARNALFVDLGAAVASGEVVIVEERPATDTGTWRRQAWILDVFTRQGTVVRVIQQTMTGTAPIPRADGSSSYPVKALIIGCQSACFAEQRAVIDRIVESWDVI